MVIFALVLTGPLLVMLILAGLIAMRMLRPTSDLAPLMTPATSQAIAAADSTFTLSAIQPLALSSPTPAFTSNTIQLLAETPTQPTDLALLIAPSATGAETALSGNTPQPSATPQATHIAGNATATLAASTAVPTVIHTPGLPTQTPAPTATPSDWVFDSVKLMPHPSQNGLLLVGEIVNHTGAAQQVLEISGNFYNEQGQLVAGRLQTAYQIPTKAVPVPVGGRMPFEVHVLDIEQAASYVLEVRAQASPETARQFEGFINSTTVTVRGRYCVNSSLTRPEPGLTDYLAITVLLLDADGKAISLGGVYEPDIDDVMSTPTHNFQICADAYNQTVGGFQLRAWGR